MTQDAAAMSAPSSGSTTVPFAPYYQDEAVTIYNADCFAVMPHVGAYSIICDPPYALNYTPDTGGKITNDKARDFWRLLLKLPEAFCLTGATTLAMFTRWDVWGEVAERMSRLWPPCNCIVWDKNNHGRGNCNHAGFSHEFIYISAPSDHIMRVEKRRPLNILRHPIVAPSKMHHPTEKPLSLMRELVQMCTRSGDEILDPFMGSGTTLVAAKLEGRKAVGIEISEKYCEAAANRLRQGVLF